MFAGVKPQNLEGIADTRNAADEQFQGRLAADKLRRGNVAARRCAFGDFPAQARNLCLSDAPCGQASFGNVASYDGKGMTVGHSSCDVTVINKSGNTYKVTSKCHSERDNTTIKHTEVYTITSDTSFTVKNEYGEFASRYCERSSLPWPWGKK
jgi:hypothetical protein